MKHARKPLVAGNWKMNGTRSLVSEFSAQLPQIDNVDVVICPPAIYMALFNEHSFALGAQDVSADDNGAHTGDISAKMLHEAGCQYVIVGHSERRADHGETSTLVASKAGKVLSEGLMPIICVGESLEERENDQVETVIQAQINAVFDALSSDELSRCVFAYEPVWAIGTGKTATPEQAQEVHAFIRKQIAGVNAETAAAVRIVYGGSMKPDNASALLAQPDIDGGLIGGASLKKDDFIAICHAAG